MQDSLQGLRLSPQQKCLWLLQGSDLGFCAQATVRLTGPLDPAALQDAVGRVVARHDMFRTTFRREPGVRVPFQVVGEHLAPRWHQLDWRADGPSDRAAELERVSAGQRRCAFNFEQGPLLDAVLVLEADHRAWLLLCLPALCADAMTLRNLVQEMSQRYAAGVNGETPAEEPAQYAQFSEWQNELLADEEAEAGKEYWQRSGVAGAPPVLLPFEQVPASAAEADVLSATASVDAKTLAALDEAARAQAAPLTMVLLACWQALLFRITGQPDVVVAIVGDGRKYEELQGTMGPLAQWLPVRCHVDAAMSFSELVSRAAAGVGEALEWQEYWMWDHQGKEAVPALADLVGFEHYALPPAWQVGALTVLLENQAVRSDRWKLKVSCVTAPSGLAVRLDYDRQRFQPEYVACLIKQFCALLQHAAQDPRAAVEDLDILGEAERRRLLSVTNDTALRSGSAGCLHHLFETWAKRMPEAKAAVCGHQQITYAELNARANQLAHALISRGVGPEVLVVLCVERSMEMLVGVLGILKAGGAYVPLDPGNARARIAYELEHSGAPVIVTQEHLLPLLPDAGATILCLDRDRVLLDCEPQANPAGAELSPQLAYVIYTSGSTGVPKGVAVTHGSAVNYTRDICGRLAVEPQWHFATVSTIGADLGNTVIFSAWGSGGCLHVIEYATATDGHLFASYMAQHPIDVLKIVPSHLSALLDSSDGRRILPRKRLILGGEALSGDLAARVIRIVEGGRLLNHYGPTETTIGALTCSWGPEEQARISSVTVPIGRPISNVDVYVLDARLRPVPVGVPGELYIGGMGLARGYLRAPEQTAERFLPHPFSTVSGSRLYKTGDLVRYGADGAIEYLGRLDHQVKIRGYRVELGEIEARLREQPLVRDAVVTAHEDRSGGGKRLVAYVVGRQGDSLDAATLRHFVSERLPEYMVPASFVFLSALPLTSNGKVDRKGLLPPDDSGQLQSLYIPPRTPLEAMLVDIWADLLKVPRVGVDDNFFDLGGHSLLAIQLTHRVQKAAGRSLSLTTIFQSPTVARLAALLSCAPSPAASPLTVLPAAGSHAPLYCFDPTGRHIEAYHPLARSLDGDRPVYGLGLSDLFQQDWKEVSIISIAERHAKVIRDHQPEGPYYLCGWSLGGIIALAVAHILEPHAVAFLGILDTQARTALYEQEYIDVLDELAEFLTQDRREAFRALPPADLATVRDRLMSLPIEDRIEYAGRWAMEHGFLPSDLPLDMLKLRYALLKDAAIVLQRFHRKPLTVPIHVWWATLTVGPDSRIPIDWTRYTTGAVTTNLVEGGHFGVVESSEVHHDIRGLLAGLDPAS